MLFLFVHFRSVVERLLCFIVFRDFCFVCLFVPPQVAAQRSASLNGLYKDADSAAIEASCFGMLLKSETAAVPRRVKEAEAAAAAEAEAEELLQV